MFLILLAATPWTALDEGLDLGRFESPTPSPVGDSQITVLRADPAHYALVLHSQLVEADGESRTAKQWAARKGLVAAINPAMFHPDLRSTEWMVTGDKVVNGDLGSGKTLLAWDPVDPSLPAVRQVDRQCDDLEVLRPQYQSWVQSIRMIACDGRNVWADRDRIWSHAVVGTDSQGRVLFIHARSPWSTHDFIDILKGLPLDLQRLQYGEGGPEATLYVKHGEVELELVGSYETGFLEHDRNTFAWSLPNVLGLVARP